MGSMQSWLCVSIFLWLCCSLVHGGLAVESSSWDSGFVRAADSKNCPDNSRLAIKLCISKVAKNKDEMNECGRIFVKSFPKCFFSTVGLSSQSTKAACNTFCASHFADCEKNSKSLGEHFTCRNYKKMCHKKCKKLSSKRNVLELLKKEIDSLASERKLKSETRSQSDSADASSLLSLIKRINGQSREVRDEDFHNEVEQGTTRRGLKSNSAGLLDLFNDEENLAKIQRSVAQIKELQADPVDDAALCAGTCQGYYDACQTQVSNIQDHVTCLEAKNQCHGLCY